jgi:hypothetical protein
MTHALHPSDGLPTETLGFYREAMRLLDEWEIPFLVGGAYALAERTGIVRHTKDFDVFLMEDDARRAARLFAEAGYRCELTFEHWLGKVYGGDDFVDLIYSSGNGLGRVDAEWFAASAAGTVLGRPARLCPAEETIWQKAFVCERERFDGADVNHLILALGPRLDWPRLLRRFGEHWRVLFAHLVFFGYVYPGHRDAVPDAVMRELAERITREGPEPGRVCRGTMISRTQYLRDIEQDGYEDARLSVPGGMTVEEAAVWTDAGRPENQP